MLIVLCIIGAVAGVLYKARVSNVGPAAVMKPIEIKYVTSKDVRKETSELIHVGDTVKDEKGVVIGKVTNIESLPNTSTLTPTSDGKWTLANKEGMVSLRLTVEGSAVISADSITINGNPYVAGMTLTMQAKSARFFGDIVSIKEK